MPAVPVPPIVGISEMPDCADGWPPTAPHPSRTSRVLARIKVTGCGSSTICLRPNRKMQDHLKELLADQRGQVSQAYRKLLQMSPDQRTQYFNSDEFRKGFNDEQRNLLRGMADLYPSPAH